MAHARTGKAAPFWIALAGLPLVCMYAIKEWGRVQTSLGATMAKPLLILGALLVLAIVWGVAVLATRAVADGLQGLVIGAVLAGAIGLVWSLKQERDARQAFAHSLKLRAQERSRLVEAMEAAHVDDTAGIARALARPSGYKVVESMCALAAADDQPLDEVLRGRPEVGRNRRGNPFRISSQDLFRIANVVVEDGQTSLPMAQATLYVVLDAWRERGDPPQLPQWRAAWEQLERRHGIAPHWPPRFQVQMGNGFDGYCDAGDDARLQAHLQALSSTTDEGASMAPPHPPAPPGGVDSVPTSRTDAR